VLLRQHGNRFLKGARPNSDNLAWKFSGVVNYGGVKMKFNSSYWYKRATEMRSVANETKNLQSKQTMLGIAHDYDLLGYQFEYREKCALRDVIRTEAFVHSAKGPEGTGP
jgi:hypothetical protein